MASKKKGGDKNDVTWAHCKPVENYKKHLQCNYCNGTFWGGVFRMKHHIARTRQNVAPCLQASEEATEIFRKLLESNKNDKEERDERRYDIARPDSFYHEKDSRTDQGEKGKRKASMDAYVLVSKKKQCTLNELWKNGERDTVCGAIARFFYANCIPFNVVKSPYFASMMEGVSHFGKGLKLPSYHELRNKYLENEVTNINVLMGIQKKEWEKRGCTIMSDGWTDGAHRSIMNFLVNSASGTYFLRSVDISSISHSAENLFELFDSVVEEVGEEHVVQFVTDCASANVKAGELLMEKRKKLFWSPCAAHLLDLMLADIGKLELNAETIAKARTISLYIYKHLWVLDLMREHTQNRELIRPALTRFATSYLTLKSIREQRVGLRSMFASKEWESSSYSKKEICLLEYELDSRDIILSDSSFWPSIKYCIKCVAPLVKVLRLLDSDEKPAMPYVYEMMDRAKEAIAKNMDNVEKRYRPIWEIIDLRWNLQLHRPLHAAACYLNPAFHYEESYNTDSEVKEGPYDLLERLCPTSKERAMIDQQLDTFKLAMGSFGREMARVTRKTKRPAHLVHGCFQYLELWPQFPLGSRENPLALLSSSALRALCLTLSSESASANGSMLNVNKNFWRQRMFQQMNHWRLKINQAIYWILCC